MSRRPGRTTLALAVAMLAFVLFGMVRASAPFGLLGFLFDEPEGFAVVAAVTSLVGAVLLFIRPVELWVARRLGANARPPMAEESARIERALATPCERSGIKRERLIVNVQEDSGMNASAGAANLLFVTTGALELDEDRLEAILAHELGHHRGLHPVLTAVVWWLRLPGAVLGTAFAILRRLVGRIRILVLLVTIWQATVMWLFWLGDLLAMRASRLSEFEADRSAARWGYAEPLARSLEGLDTDLGQAGLPARLLASHPPLGERIERLHAFSG